jgi:hypothetical protein
MTFEDKPHHCPENSGKIHPMTRRDIPDELKFQCQTQENANIHRLRTSVIRNIVEMTRDKTSSQQVISM